MAGQRRLHAYLARASHVPDPGWNRARGRRNDRSLRRMLRARGGCGHRYERPVRAEAGRRRRLCRHRRASFQGELQRRGDPHQRRCDRRRLALQALGGVRAAARNRVDHEDAGAQDHQHALPLGSHTGQPGLHQGQSEIIASERTRANLASPDAGAGGYGYIEKQLAALPKEIDKLKEDVGRARDPEQKKRLAANFRQFRAYYEELKNIKPPLPTRTLTKSVTLNEGGREIQILLLGRAHTDGDVFIYLPKEKVVATGDALIDWMPFLNDGYP